MTDPSTTTEEKPEFGGMRAWLMAARLHTLPAGASPVFLGTAIAYRDGIFSLTASLGALLGALLIQVGTNFANDYFDAQKGVDRPDRTGFTRVTQEGLLSEESVKAAMWVCFGLAVLVGSFLVLLGGVPILLVGLTGLFFALTYSGGPVPFGSIGLGDLLVFLYFGVIAVVGTYYVQAVPATSEFFPIWPPAGTVPLTAVIASLAPAALCTAVLVVNNLRDIPTDREAGKWTLAVLIGRTGSRIEYVGLLLLSLAVPVWFALQPDNTLFFLLPLASLPLAYLCARNVLQTTEGEVLNQTLSRTGQLLLLHSVLFAVSFVLDKT